MATLSELRNRIKRDLIITTTEYDTRIDDAIRSALRSLKQGKYWFLLKRENVTLATNNDSVALPSDLGSLKAARLLSSGAWYAQGRGFTQKPLDVLYREYKTYATTQQPEFWALEGTSLVTDSSADADYTIELSYWRKDASEPTSDAATSVWFEDGLDLIRTKAIVLFKSGEGWTVKDMDLKNERDALSDLQSRNNLYAV
jgi:hypothetical protein